jgi:hypothetical protein
MKRFYIEKAEMHNFKTQRLLEVLLDLAGGNDEASRYQEDD